MDEPPDDAIQLPIDGVLDLHTFAPREVKNVVAAYLDACVECGLVELRIVHGKGVGTLRTIVHRLLERDPRELAGGGAARRAPAANRTVIHDAALAAKYVANWRRPVNGGVSSRR
jgi:DNA-nicking Smr family endonuclease